MTADQEAVVARGSVQSSIDKDWLHLNVFDHDREVIGLVNLSLHGPVHDARARVVGAALFHNSDGAWLGGLDVRDRSQAVVRSQSIALERIAIGLDQSGAVHSSARFADWGVELSVIASPTGSRITTRKHVPFGTGWIAWDAQPRLSLRGEIRIGGHALDLTHATAYQDRNWGRWHWGDDIGWEWGVFHASCDGPSIFVGRTTNRAHGRCDSTVVGWQSGKQRRTWRGDAVKMRWQDPRSQRIRRFPGAMAALHADRARPQLPTRLVICADDGIDSLELAFAGSDAAQVIAADPVRRGYGFLHEIAGTFAVESHIARRRMHHSGLAVVEYV
jgi:hypothetical protein